jgi:hypothetical protein
MNDGTASVPPASALAIASLAGAIVLYLVTYRDTRLKAFSQNPKNEWRVLVFDLFGFLACAVLVTVYLIEPTTTRGAFLAGASWQGLLGGALAGTELKKLRNHDPGAKPKPAVVAKPEDRQ